MEELYTRSGIVTQIVSNSELMGDDKFPYTQQMFFGFLATLSHWFRTVSSNTPAVRSKLCRCDFPSTSFVNKTELLKKLISISTSIRGVQNHFFFTKSFSFL